MNSRAQHAISRPSPPVHRPRALVLSGVAAVFLVACGGSVAGTASAPKRTAAPTRARSVHGPKTSQVSYPRLLGTARASAPTGFVPVATLHGRPAAWIARSSSGIALLSFDQRLTEVRLHSGTTDAGPTGWRFGPAITGGERRRVIAAFNGGFKFSTDSGGFVSYGRVAVPVRNGLGSVVTYSDGSTDVGTWGTEVPAAGRTVVSVRQNLRLIIDRGAGASNLACLSCWGATLGGAPDPARAGLGVTADGRLIWAGGEHLTAGALASALRSANVVRAVQLDINPEWVAGYLYAHRGAVGRPAPVAVAPGQVGIPGQYLSPTSRDFFAVQAR